MNNDRSLLLRRTLATNALVTLLFGAVLLVDRGLVADVLGIASALPVAVAGLVCIAFAPVLLVAARKRDLDPRAVALLIAVDGLWVLASLVVAIVAPITLAGRGLVLAQAALVAVFMALDAAGARRRTYGLTA